MTLSLYAATWIARKEGTLSISQSSITASHYDAAKTLAEEKMWLEFPHHQGYTNHQTVVLLIPNDQILDVVASQLKQ